MGTVMGVRLLVLTSAALMLPASAASAGTVTSDGNTVTYQADPGQENIIETEFDTLSDGTPGIRVTDKAFEDYPVQAGTGCEQGAVFTAVCPGRAGVVINLGDGNDELVGGDPNEQANGGDGNDKMIGRVGDDQLDGGPGDDELEGTSQDGQPANRAGADVLRGGSGVDTASFFNQDTPVSISLDGVNNDSGGDNVMNDIEVVLGGNSDDTLTGDETPNGLFGRAGNDIVRGGGGNDTVDGGRNNDQLFGDGGDDQVLGSHGDDALDGGPGQDGLNGDGGDQACGSISCLDAASDQINARDGERDSVVCGLFVDTVTADRADDVDVDCENVDRGVGGEETGPGLEAAFPSRLPRWGTALRRGFGVRASCTKACTLAGIATVSGSAARRLKLVSARTRTVARGGGTLSAAGERQIKLRFTRKAKRRLKRLRRVKLTVTITAVDSAGEAESVRAKVTLRR